VNEAMIKYGERTMVPLRVWVGWMMGPKALEKMGLSQAHPLIAYRKMPNIFEGLDPSLVGEVEINVSEDGTVEWSGPEEIILAIQERMRGAGIAVGVGSDGKPSATK
jgi:hypothetical protein